MPLQTPQALPPAQGAQLAAHVDVLLELPALYLLVPQQRLKQAWPRSRGRRPQRCADLPCQLALAREVMAGRVLEIRVERNIMGQCEVFAELIDVPAGATLARARAPGACAEEALLRSLSKAVCYVFVQDAAAVGQTLTHEQCLIMSQLAGVDHSLEQLKTRRRELRDLAALERALAEEVLQLKGSYQQVAAAGQGPWAISATCRLGSLYEAYGQVISESYQKMPLPPAVRRQGAKASEEFRQQLARMVAQKVAPIEKEARDHYVRCVESADAARVSTPLIERARRRAGR